MEAAAHVCGDGEMLPPESDDGKVEYKLQLVNPSHSRFVHLVSQLKFRMQEGQGPSVPCVVGRAIHALTALDRRTGEAIYEVGVGDNGFPQGLSEADLNSSIETVRRMANELKAGVTVLSMRSGELGRVAELLVRTLNVDDSMDIRVAVCGNVDSGKSTLVGVLTRGQLDDGRGQARLAVFTHRHEVETGRTIAISHQIIGTRLQRSRTSSAGRDGAAGVQDLTRRATSRTMGAAQRLRSGRMWSAAV